jgi:hypothetical protein
MFQIISGTYKTVSGTQNLERNVPNTAHKNVPTNSVLLGTLFQLAFPVTLILYCMRRCSIIPSYYPLLLMVLGCLRAPTADGRRCLYATPIAIIE